MANILSFKSVAEIEGARIVMDTNLGESIFVYLSDGHAFEFKQFSNVLYYFDTSVANNSNNSPVTNYSMLQTVSSNK